MTYQTTAIYLSGAICGDLWMGGLAGTPHNIDLQRERNRCGEQPSIRDLLLLVLAERGGDFQGAEFAADTVIRIERRNVQAPGVYTMHIRERELANLPDCADLVNMNAYSSDFFGDCD